MSPSTLWTWTPRSFSNDLTMNGSSRRTYRGPAWYKHSLLVDGTFLSPQASGTLLHRRQRLPDRYC